MGFDLLIPPLRIASTRMWRLVLKWCRTGCKFQQDWIRKNKNKILQRWFWIKSLDHFVDQIGWKLRWFFKCPGLGHWWREGQSLCHLEGAKKSLENRNWNKSDMFFPKGSMLKQVFDIEVTWRILNLSFFPFCDCVSSWIVSVWHEVADLPAGKRGKCG